MDLNVNEFPTGGTAQSRNRANRVASILQASKDALTGDGYAAFATRRVAARVGITLSNLQYYFKSREELLKATVQWVLSQYLEHWEQTVKGAGSPQRRFQVLIENLIKEIQGQDNPRFLFEVWALAQHDVGVRGVVEQAYLKYRDLVAQLLQEFNPVLEADECRVRATILTGQAEGMMILSACGGDNKEDYAAMARALKRGFRLLAAASSFEHPTNAPSGRLPSQSGTSAAPATLPRAWVFGSEGHLAHARLGVGLPDFREDAPYNRPTAQSLRRTEKTNEIVTAAANLLATEGYGNFTQARVANLAGILPSGLQHYFSTHTDLLRATIHGLMRTYLDRYSAMMTANGKAADVRLDEILDDVMTEARDSRVVRFSLEVFALAQREEFVSVMVVRLYRAYREIFVSLVSEMDPAASSRERYARATLIAATVEGLMVHIQNLKLDAAEVDSVFRMAKSIAFQAATGRRV